MEVSRDSALYYLTSSTFGMICNCVLSKGHFATHAAAGEERIFPRNRNGLNEARSWKDGSGRGGRQQDIRGAKAQFELRGVQAGANVPDIFHKMSGTAYKI